MSAPYGWPVKPFDKQHPVRGYLNDPRIQDASHAFHFGVDVSAPDGTAVYSVTPGKVFIEDKGNAVAVQAPDGVAFGYWHVAPAVKHHQQVKLHQLLGHIEKGWGHVHFAESLKNVYRDPIRPGALTPFVDMGHPTVEKIMFRIGKRTLPPNKVYGLVNICCIAYDTTPILVPPPVVAHAGRSRAAAIPGRAERQGDRPVAQGRAICGPSASRTRSTSSTRTTRRRTTRTSPGCSCTSWPTTGTAPCTRTATTGSTSRPRTSIRTRRSRACRSRS